MCQIDVQAKRVPNIHFSAQPHLGLEPWAGLHHVFRDKARATIDRSRGFGGESRLAFKLDDEGEKPTKMSPIREVWAPNLDIEMRNIRDLIDKYPFVALV